VANGPGRGSGTPGAGLGLVGMRERAELHGGRLDAGPTPDGGFRVVAQVPVDGGSGR
jgi:signal transduction histidine kinase